MEKKERKKVTFFLLSRYVYTKSYPNKNQKKKAKNGIDEKKRYGSPTVFAFILKSIKYVVDFLIIPMKTSTTIITRQIPSTTPISSIINYSTSRRRQTEVFEDYSQVRVYYIQGFSIEIKKQQSSLITFVILAFFFVLAENSIPFPSFCLLLIIEKKKKKKENIRIDLMNCVRRVCEQHKKRKCICICRMGCGSTKATATDEENVSLMQRNRNAKDFLM